MVAVFIFALHIIAAFYAFLREKKNGGRGEGLLAVGFTGIIFAVGWTIATMLTNLLFASEAFVKWFYQETSSLFLQTLRKEINRDAISLLLLTFGEVAFYYYFLRSDKVKEEREKEGKGSVR